MSFVKLRFAGKAAFLLSLLLSNQYSTIDAEKNEKTNHELRQEAFEFLFTEFVSDKECVWQIDRLEEIVIFDRKETKESKKTNSIKHCLYLKTRKGWHVFLTMRQMEHLE